MSDAVSDATRAAYARWAPRYPAEPHNPLMRAEQALMWELCPEIAERRVLDLACGTGRYAQLLTEHGAGLVVAVDICLPMLAQVRGAQRICADMRQLPFAASSFDIVVSGLAVGHVRDLCGWAAELARVLAPGGSLLYSDFHPDAAQAGLTRSFRDADERRCTVPHFRHCLDAQFVALRAAGFKVAATRTVRVGQELREAFENSAALYANSPGLALVLIVRAER